MAAAAPADTPVSMVVEEKEEDEEEQEEPTYPDMALAQKTHVLDLDSAEASAKQVRLMVR